MKSFSEFRIQNQILEFQPKFWNLTQFQNFYQIWNFDQILEFWLNLVLDSLLNKKVQKDWAETNLSIALSCRKLLLQINHSV